MIANFFKIVMAIVAVGFLISRIEATKIDTPHKEDRIDYKVTSILPPAEKKRLRDKYSIQTSYPHVSKKNGSFDTRQGDLWELAQDWVFYKGQIMKFAREGDKKELRKSQEWFQKTTAWMAEYREDDVQKAVRLAESQ